MLSKYGILCEVVSEGSFTKVAEKYGYAQSSVSAAVKSVEEELSVRLIDRSRGGISWTKDGEQYAPYLRAVYNAEQALERKNREILGLEGQVIRIGTFTSVSRDILPPMMEKFRKVYPGVSFELYQGGYEKIRDMLESDQVDLGFISEELGEGLDLDFLYEDGMSAVLPKDHPLAGRDVVSLEDLSREPLILLDEGRYSTALRAFAERKIEVQVAYRVEDDYSILSMIRSHLGISLLFENVVRGFEEDVAVRPLAEPIKRRICLACRDAQTLPYAAARLRKFIRASFH